MQFAWGEGAWLVWIRVSRICALLEKNERGERDGALWSICQST